MPRPLITVAQLIDVLRALPTDSTIVLSSDPEGNNFRPLSGIEEGWGRGDPARMWEPWFVGTRGSDGKRMFAGLVEALA